MDDGYDPLVYENTWGNIGTIIGMLMVFYVFQFLHWNANFALGTADTEACTIYNLIIFGSAIIVIIIMLIMGAGVNKKKLTHEFYMEKISEEKQRMAEEQAKEAQKRANKAAMNEYEAQISKQWEFCHKQFIENNLQN